MEKERETVEVVVKFQCCVQAVFCYMTVYYEKSRLDSVCHFVIISDCLLEPIISFAEDQCMLFVSL